MTLQSSGDVLINRAEPGNFMAGIFCLADWELLLHNGVDEFINSNLKIKNKIKSITYDSRNFCIRRATCPMHHQVDKFLMYVGYKN